MRKAKRGFTLVELLVVISIIAMLMGILFPVITKVRILSRKVVCKANLHACAVGFRMYLDEYEDVMPYAALLPSAKLNDLPRIVDVLEGYIGTAGSLKCPGDPKGKYFLSEGSSYEYHSMLGGQKVANTFLAEKFGVSQIHVLRDYESFHGKKGRAGSVMYLYADAHIGDRTGASQ